MRVLRMGGGVVIGYLIFAFGSMFLAGPAMAADGIWIVVPCLIGLALIGGASGLAAATVAGGDRRLVGYVVAGLVVLATVANLIMGFGAEPNWYKIGTLVLTAPAILLVS